jgi:tetratricopeptide (TPR) repeat protein
MYESTLKTARPAIAERIYLRIGEAFVRQGDSDHPAALYYQGHCYEQNRGSDSAIPIWLRARETAAPLLKTILSRHIAWAYIETGLLSYQKKEISQAIILWEKALGIDSGQIQAAYYLSRAYFDQASYRKSIEAGRRVLSLSRNKLLNADTLANMGDSYWKLHDFAAARRAYQAALKLDPVDNPRIVKALGGT